MQTKPRYPVVVLSTHLKHIIVKFDHFPKSKNNDPVVSKVGSGYTMHKLPIDAPILVIHRCLLKGLGSHTLFNEKLNGTESQRTPK